MHSRLFPTGFVLWVSFLGAVNLLAQAPANDQLESSEIIQGAEARFSVSSFNATREAGEPRHANQAGSGSLWWFWAPPASGQAVLDLSGSGFDTVTAVYLGKSVDALSLIGLDNNSGNDGVTSKLIFPVEAGNDYRLVVDGARPGQFGNIEFFLKLITIPEIFEQPKSHVVTTGNQVSFSVLAYGQQPLSYQWQKDGDDIEGATNVGLVLNGVALTAAAEYTVQVRNSLGTAVSDPGVLTVLREPEILRHPVDQNVRARSDVSFSVEAIGQQPLAFQWFKDKLPLAGEQAASLTLSSVETSDEGEFHVEVTNSAGKVSSEPAELQVVPIPPNDDHVNRIFIPLNQGAGETPGVIDGQAEGVNVSASFEGGEPRHANVRGGKSVWWEILAPEQEGFITIDLSRSNFDTLLGVYTGPAVDRLTTITSDNNSGTSNRSKVSFVSKPNQRYAIAVDGSGGSEGRVRLDVLYKPGDEVVIRNVGLGRFGLLNGIGGGLFAIGGCGNGGFQANAATDTGAPLSYQWFFNGSLLPEATSSSLSFTDAQPDLEGDYFAQITSIGRVTNTPIATLVINPVPRISRQPSGTTVQECKSASFSVGVEGCGPFTYQWLLNGNAVTGGTESTLELASVGADDQEDYSVIVRNAGGEVASRTARLTINRLPVITEQPRSIWRREGSTITLKVQAESCDAVNYEWRFNGNGILRPGFNSMGWSNVQVEVDGTLTLSNAVGAQTGRYHAVVSNGIGTVDSSAANVTVAVPPPNDLFARAIEITGTNTMVEGHNWAATKETGEQNYANNQGGNSVWWHWKSPLNQFGYGTNFVDLSRSTFNTTLAIYQGTSLEDLFQVAADNDGGDSNRRALFYPVTPGLQTFVAVDGWNASTGKVSLDLFYQPEPTPPVVVEQPQSQAAKNGETVEFSVASKGAPFIQHQWFFKGQAMAGATNAVLRLENVLEEIHEGAYTVSLKNFFGATNSFVAQLTFGAIVGGQVTDATNGRPIPNARVEAGGLVTHTDEDGNYQLIGLESAPINPEFDAVSRLIGWNQDAEFINLSTRNSVSFLGEKEEFTDYVNHQVRIARGEAFDLSFSMPPILMTPILTGGMRFVLNWGEDPADLDAHLLTPSINGNSYEVFHLEQGNEDEAPFVVLDHDVRQSYGPESITVKRFFEGKYQFFVKEFDVNSFGDLSNSDAVVKIYDALGLLRTLAVPSNQSGRFWHVAEVDGANRNIRLINRLTDLTPQSIVDGEFPSPLGIQRLGKRDSRSGLRVLAAPTGADIKYSWNFGDGRGTSEDVEPRYRYENPGVYQIRLDMEGIGNGELAKEFEQAPDFITVTNGAPSIAFDRLRPGYIVKADRDTEISVTTQDAEPEGWITRVEFFINGREFNEDVEAPFGFVWHPLLDEDELERTFSFRSVAYDQHGEPGSTGEVIIRVKDLNGDVLIVPNQPDPEIALLEEAIRSVDIFDHDLDSLREMIPRVLAQEDLEFRLITEFKTIVWHDLGTLEEGLEDNVASVFSQAYVSGIPIYSIGEHLLQSATSLSPEQQGQWRRLTGLGFEMDRGTSKEIELVKDPEISPDLHPVLAWPYGEVFDFSYPRAPELGVSINEDSEVLAVAGDSVAMLAFPSRALGDAAFEQVRSIAQNFRVYLDSGNGDDFERETLFRNSICWLVDCDPCVLFDVWLTGEVSASVFDVGDEVEFNLLVHHNGACQASGGIVEAILPENLEFVEGETPKGFIDQDGRHVTFRIGIISNATVIPIRLKTKAVKPGKIQQTFSIRVNGRNLRDPEMELSLLVDGVIPEPEPKPPVVTPEPPRVVVEPPVVAPPSQVEPEPIGQPLPVTLVVERRGTGIRIIIETSPGRTVKVERSIDLRNWTELADLDSGDSGVVTTSVASLLEEEFFRAIADIGVKNVTSNFGIE
ncbi:PKD domain-containing protein [bacterium]|nr:PKD domain-containing protein [bacterium]